MKDRHQIAPYPIRMPPELREQLESVSKAGSRSLHAEIIQRLTDSFSLAPAADPSLLDSHRQLADALIRYLTEPGSQNADAPALIELAEQLRASVLAVNEILRR